MPQTTEEEIHAANLGQPRLLNSAIFLAPYDAFWPLMFSSQARRIRHILGEAIGTRGVNLSSRAVSQTGYRYHPGGSRFD